MSLLKSGIGFNGKHKAEESTLKRTIFNFAQQKIFTYSLVNVIIIIIIAKKHKLISEDRNQFSGWLGRGAGWRRRLLIGKRKFLSVMDIFINLDFCDSFINEYLC